MTTRDVLLMAYLLLNAALETIAYTDDEGNECLDALFCTLAGEVA
jgi:hypothetical protein